MLADYVRQNFDNVQGQLLRNVYVKFTLSTGSTMGYREFLEEMERIVVLGDDSRAAALVSPYTLQHLIRTLGDLQKTLEGTDILECFSQSTGTLQPLVGTSQRTFSPIDRMFTCYLY